VRRWWGALSAALVLCAGCHGGSGAGPTPSFQSSAGTAGTTVSVTPAPSYPNARPGEKPPARPVDVLSDQGAEAFARYFMQAVDWAYASMDSSLMRSAYDPATCNYCNQAANRTDADRAAGKRYEGGRSTIIDVMSAHGADVTNNLVNVVFDASAVKVYDATGSVVSDTEPELKLQFNVRVRYGTGWIVSEVKQVITAS
jgi:hypothetical protein